MIHRDTPLGHHFFKITQAQRVRHVPAHTQQDHVQWVVQSLSTLPKSASSVLRGVFFLTAIVFVFGVRLRILAQC